MASKQAIIIRIAAGLNNSKLVFVVAYAVNWIVAFTDPDLTETSINIPNYAPALSKIFQSPFIDGVFVVIMILYEYLI